MSKYSKVVIVWLPFFVFVWLVNFFIPDHNHWATFPAILTGIFMFVMTAWLTVELIDKEEEEQP